MTSVRLQNMRNQAALRPSRNSVRLRLVQVKTAHFFVSAALVVPVHTEVS